MKSSIKSLFYQIDMVQMFGSNISSTESNVDICIGKAWTAIDKLSTMWKSGLPDKKTGILPSYSHVSTTVWLHHLDSNEMLG